MLKRMTAVMLALSVIITMLWAVPASAETDGASFSIEMPETTTIKSELTVDILIRNNPGLCGAVLQLEYDSNIFTLTGAQPGELCTANGTALVEWVAGKTAVAVAAREAIAGDGVLVKLTFCVADTVTAGSYNIKVSSSELVDGNLQPFSAASAEEAIAVMDYIWGDANGDKKVDVSDVQTILRRLVHKLKDSDLNMTAADADRSGELGLPDAIILLQWLSQYVEWDPNGSTLPPIGV